MRDPTKFRELYKAKRAAEVKYNQTFEKAVTGDLMAQHFMLGAAKELQTAHDKWWAEAEHFVTWKR